jgi:Na+-driven multidrug efflux pump
MKLLHSADQTVSLVLRLAAVATFGIGLITLLAPSEIIHIFDGYDPGNYHFIRFIGTALIGFAVTNWLYSSFHSKEVVLPAIYGNLTSLILAVLVDAIGLVAGVLAPAAWLILLLHAFFAGAFIYCVLLIRKANS